ncbi:ribosomal RNA small subunit methyltransferase G-like [Prunus yedoensis var. nudiflora]|uniref:Ribosomal RNA small subunit methyltransferase G-like n=1 Tax=Prunus yedoensis var. nudiflora TaxID=2094558 RepID=A0A314YXH9_PRUYE|nr:ribosomal RNA small subunit methyltransferase G-like [Prunus yedoensis var. nudiflora]
MLVSRCVVPFSLGTFIKHLPISKRTTFCPYRIRPKTITTTRILCSSYFETLDSHQKEQIHLYVDTLLEWNQRMNLTAVKEVKEVMERHIEDSLAIIPPIRNSHLSHCSPSSSNNLCLVDVGSGAGLPGLVLAIACPGQNLGQALCFREKFDVAVARAVAEMRVLAEYCLPLVCVGGLFVAAKGHDPEVEVRNAEKAIQILGASVLQLCPVESHSPYGQRTAIVCLKTNPTPRKYPRDPGTPEKTPL